MRTWSAFLALALGAVVATTAGAADDKRPTDTSRTERDARREFSDRKEIKPHPGGLVEASWLIGSRVHDPQGKTLGKIESIWLDPKDGHVKEVTLSIGATLGVGGKDKIVAWNDLKLAWKDQKLFVSVDPTALRDAYQTKMDRDDRGAAASPATSSKRH